MKKNLINKVWLRVAMIVVVVTTAFAGTAQADDVLYKTALFGSTNCSAPINSYSQSWTASNGGFTVSLSNFANAAKKNESDYWGYAGCGTYGVSTPATIRTTAPIDKPISRVDLTIDAITAQSFTSIKLSSTADYDTWRDEGTFTLAVGTQSVTIASPDAHRYYYIDFYIGSVYNAPAAKISKVEYYRYYDPSTVEVPVISGNPAPTFASSTEVTITCPTDGATIEYSTDNGVNWTTYSAPFTLDKTTTVKAKAVKEGLTESAVVSKTFSLAADVEDVTWDLKTQTYASSSNDLATWTSPEAVMSIKKTANSNNVSVTSPDNRNGTTIKSGQILQFAPVEGYSITSVEIYTNNTGLSGINGTWNNASATIDGSTMIVVPEDGTMAAYIRATADTKVTGVKVNYTPTSSPYITAEEEVTVASTATSGSVDVIYNRVDNAGATLLVCNATGAAATYDWFSAEFDANKDIAYTVTANSGAARTAYVKVSANVTIRGQVVTLSALVAMTQEAGGAVEETIVMNEYGYMTYVTQNNVSLPEGLTAYIVTGASTSSVTMEEIETIPAGTPVVLQGAEGSHTLTIVSTADEVTGNQLQVSDGTQVGDGSTIYVLSVLNDKVGFYRKKAGYTIAAGKAYLVISAGIKEFYGFGEDDATGIKTIDNGQLTMDNEIYNIAGQRISKMQKGINIVNGKKILF